MSMAQNAIGNSAGIFLNGSQLYQNANQNIFNAIQQAADIYDKMRMQKQANLDSLRAKQLEMDAQRQKDMFTEAGATQILAKAKQFGVQSLTPEERSAFDAFQQQQATKVAIQPQTGQAYNPYQPISLDGMPVPGGQSVPLVQEEPLPERPGVSDFLIPPRVNGGDGTQQQFDGDMSAPAPLGKHEQRKANVDTSAPTDSGIGSTPTGQMKRWEKELDFYGKRLEKNLDVELDEKAVQKNKNLAQIALDRMIEINDELKKKGAVVSGEQSTLQNIGAMARGATVGAPLVGSAEVGASAEKAFDPKTRALREEYERLRSTLLPFYAHASGLGAKSLDSDAERKSMLDSFGNPNGTYEGNKAQLQNLSKMIGTGAKEEPDVKGVEGVKPSFNEGQTATNPKTGEKMVFKGGKWLKM